MLLPLFHVVRREITLAARVRIEGTPQSPLDNNLQGSGQGNKNTPSPKDLRSRYSAAIERIEFDSSATRSCE